MRLKTGTKQLGNFELCYVHSIPYSVGVDLFHKDIFIFGILIKFTKNSKQFSFSFFNRNSGSYPYFMLYFFKGYAYQTHEFCKYLTVVLFGKYFRVYKKVYGKF